MPGTLLILGPFRFAVDTAAFEELTRSSKWDWKPVDRVGTAPALQFTGPQNDTISLNGKLVPNFGGGVEQLARMRLMADFGTPLSLIDGTGRVLGLWVIEGLDDTGSRHFKDGYPRLVTFTLTLKKYSDGTGLLGLATKVSKAISLFG